MSAELNWRERVIGKLTARDGYHGIALDRPVAERAAIVVLEDVISALELAYHPQSPTLMHPGDFITLCFELDGHEGLRTI